MGFYCIKCNKDVQNDKGDLYCDCRDERLYWDSDWNGWDEYDRKNPLTELDRLQIKFDNKR